MVTEGAETWRDYQKLVLHQLKQLNDRMEALEEQQVLQRIDLAQRKVKSGLIGAAAGSVPAIAAAVIMAVTN